MMMIGYATVGTNDVSKSIPFFTELLGTNGVVKLFDHPNGGAAFAKDGKLFLGVLEPYDKQPATVGNGTMIALQFPTPAEVDAFHAKALTLGATDEGKAGERGPGFYMSYFRDLDGNKFCACCIG